MAYTNWWDDPVLADPAGREAAWRDLGSPDYANGGALMAPMAPMAPTYGTMSTGDPVSLTAPSATEGDQSPFGPYDPYQSGAPSVQRPMGAPSLGPGQGYRYNQSTSTWDTAPFAPTIPNGMGSGVGGGDGAGVTGGTRQRTTPGGVTRMFTDAEYQQAIDMENQRADENRRIQTVLEQARQYGLDTARLAAEWQAKYQESMLAYNDRALAAQTANQAILQQIEWYRLKLQKQQVQQGRQQQRPFRRTTGVRII